MNQNQSNNEQQWHGSARVEFDITYCEDSGLHPQARFDFYRCADDGNAHPVFIYLHGGGYAVGSKSTNDLSCMGPGVEALFAGLLERGCCVVSANYTLTPEATYPRPVEELALLLGYVRAHAQEYGIDMDRVALGGGSAGGQIVGQYAALATDAEYRARALETWLGGESARNVEQRAIAAEIEDGTVQAVYLGCALLDPVRFAKTGDAETDEKFSQMQEAYFAKPEYVKSVEGTDALEESNVIAHASSGYPPTYLTDGNYVTFDDQTREMDAVLAELGVEHVTNMVGEGSKAKVPHGYDVQDRDDARENAAQAAAFICEHLGL